jgi:hypothetical protein
MNNTAVSNWSKYFLFCAIAAGLTACGSIPAAKMKYFNADSKVSFKIVRSVICDKNNLPLVANAVTPTVVHSASAQSQELDFGQLRGTFVDTDLKFEFYEDGRLKSVNASQTGQGEAVLKAATTLAGSIMALATNPPPSFITECAFIKSQAGDKPISLSYEGAVDTSKVGSAQTIAPEASSYHYEQALRPAIGEICAVVRTTGKPVAPIIQPESDPLVTLHARQPGWAEIAIMTKTIDGCASTPLWAGRINIAQLGVEYLIPIPKPTFFGKQTFGVGFQESGALGSLQYTSSGGAAQMLGGANSLVTFAQGESTAQKVAGVKADADLIAQQQRLLMCMADPKTCK